MKLQDDLDELTSNGSNSPVFIHRNHHGIAQCSSSSGAVPNGFFDADTEWIYFALKKRPTRKRILQPNTDQSPAAKGKDGGRKISKRLRTFLQKSFRKSGKARVESGVTLAKNDDFYPDESNNNHTDDHQTTTPDGMNLLVDGGSRVDFSPDQRNTSDGGSIASDGGQEGSAGLDNNSKTGSRLSINTSKSQGSAQSRSSSPKAQRFDRKASSPNGNYGSTRIQSVISATQRFLSPTYKTRCDEFKRLFKEVPEEEKFVIDYSCALQRDILIQGRLYISLGYVCFYANILKWETNLALSFRNITSITKEKTAKVIPNAIQICTKTGEKYFFSSFTSREKAFLILFKSWQYSLLDQPLCPAELYAWAQDGYTDDGQNGTLLLDDITVFSPGSSDINSPGSDIGFVDCDINVISPTPTTVKNGSRLHQNLSFSSVDRAASDVEVLARSGVDHLSEPVKPHRSNSSASFMLSRPDPNANPILHSESAIGVTDEVFKISSDTESTKVKRRRKSGQQKLSGVPSTSDISVRLQQREAIEALISPTVPFTLGAGDLSDSSDNEGEIGCNCASHVGKEILNTIYPVSADQMFLLLFTDSGFYRNMQNFRKTTDLVFNDWYSEDATNTKKRQIAYTVALNHSMGPKSSAVTEKQTITKESVPGRLYIITSEVQNFGIPYSDTFYVFNTYCLSRVTSGQCRLRVHGAVQYKKSCWGIVKNFIEKNAIAGIQDFYNDLDVRLKQECSRLGLSAEPPGTKMPRRPRRKSRRGTIGQDDLLAEVDDQNELGTTFQPPGIKYPLVTPEIEKLAKVILFVLVMMILMSGLLFYKLWSFETAVVYNDRLPSLRAIDQQLLLDFQKIISSRKDVSVNDWLRMVVEERHQRTMQSYKWAELIGRAIDAIDSIETTLKDLKFAMKMETVHTNVEVDKLPVDDGSAEVELNHHSGAEDL